MAALRRVLQVNSAASRESIARAASRLADVVSNAGYSQARLLPHPTMTHAQSLSHCSPQSQPCP